jgi:hypothetical protein
MKRLHLLLALLPMMMQAQSLYHDLGFVRDTSLIVKHDSVRLANAWAGGMNSVHFNTMDLNFDGKKDLVVFDKNGPRLRTYLNMGAPGESNYTYAPEYANYFPEIMGWMNLVDCDGDGKEELFTYVPGGIRVYTNTSTPSGGISFTLTAGMVNSSYGAGMPPTNILVTEDDMPIIYDLD